MGLKNKIKMFLKHQTADRVSDIVRSMWSTLKSCKCLTQAICITKMNTIPCIHQMLADRKAIRRTDLTQYSPQSFIQGTR